MKSTSFFLSALLLGVMTTPATAAAQPASANRAGTQAIMTYRTIGQNGLKTTVEMRVDLSQIHFDSSDAQTTQGFGGTPPGAPETPSPPAPGEVPDTTDSVNYHQVSGGYERDTRYDRDLPIVDGRIAPGPWRLIEDILKACSKMPGVSCMSG